MSLNIGVIRTLPCVNLPPGVDARCDDPAFALSNPDICPTAQSFIIKPGVALVCELGSVKFRAFKVANGTETDVTAGTVFTSSNGGVILVSATTGDATGVAAGEATVTASYQGLTAQSEVSVLAGENCCDDVSVAMMVVVDQSKSMTQAFGTGYTNKLAYAKAAAIALIDSVNENKDTVGLLRFTKDVDVVLASPTSNKASVAALAATIAQTQDDTEFYDAIGTAIAALDLTNADRKVLVIISDGEDTADSYLAQNPMILTDNFKASGGIVICVGVRAHANGYSLLSAMATGGFFLNAYQLTAENTLNYLIGLKGYICGGSCGAAGDEFDYRGVANYSSLINWDCTFDYDAVGSGSCSPINFGAGTLDPLDASILHGAVDLQGNGFFDYLPGNGLYLDLVSSTIGTDKSNPMLISKAVFSLTAGEAYYLAVKLAGPQVSDQNSVPPTIIIGAWDTATGETVFIQSITINDFNQPFNSYGYTFTAPTPGVNVKLLIWQCQGGSADSTPDTIHGALLGDVTFRNLTTSETLLFDDFNTENPTYVGPKCGLGTVWTDIGSDTVPIPELAAPTAAIVATAVANGSGTMVDESGGGFMNSVWYNYTFVTDEGETTDGPTSNIINVNGGFTGSGFNAVSVALPVVLDPRVNSIRIYRSTTGTVGHANYLVAEVSAGTASYLDLEKQSVWDARAASEFALGETIRPVVNTTSGTTIVPAFGYLTGYDCYGEGCLDTPPISQLQDPNPLPNLEMGTGGGVFSSTQTGCAPACAVNFVNIGEPLTTETLVIGEEYEKAIQLNVATAIKRWRVSFNRDWSEIGEDPIEPLRFYGSNDGSTWTLLDTQTQITGGVAGLSLIYTLPSESAAYEFYRATLGPGNPTDDGKVLALEVYKAPDDPVCKTATAQGGTAAQAMANALQAAINAAASEMHCVQVYTATEIYTDGDTTGSATAQSLNSQEEAQILAAAAAAAAIAP